MSGGWYCRLNGVEAGPFSFEELTFLVVRGKESEITRRMRNRALSRDKSNVLSTSPGGRSITRTYHCERPGRLEFSPACEEQGARLRLRLEGPDGKRLEKEGTSTFVIEAPDAAASDWECVIIALTVPCANSPIRSPSVGKPSEFRLLNICVPWRSVLLQNTIGVSS